MFSLKYKDHQFDNTVNNLLLFVYEWICFFACLHYCCRFRIM